jgi:ABC-type phosphate transport system permease subunit
VSSVLIVSQKPPIIVKLVEPPHDPTGIAHVIFEALGLTGVITLLAVVLGIALAGVMFWMRSKSGLRSG